MLKKKCIQKRFGLRDIINRDIFVPQEASKFHIRLAMTKGKVAFLIFSVILISVSGCKSKQCKQENTISGMIVKTMDLKKGGDAGSVVPGEWVIQHDTTYIQCFDSIMDTLPAIDFNQYTLLGFYSDQSCESSYDRNVRFDNATQTYIYTLTVYECKSGGSGCPDNNWVLVPKLPLNWKVDFDKKLE